MEIDIATMNQNYINGTIEREKLSGHLVLDEIKDKPSTINKFVDKIDKRVKGLDILYNSLSNEKELYQWVADKINKGIIPDYNKLKKLATELDDPNYGLIAHYICNIDAKIVAIENATNPYI